MEKGCLRANPKIVCREEESEALLFNPETGAIKLLNGTGYEIWKLCDGRCGLEEIAGRIKKEYPDADSVSVEKDTADFIGFMEKADLIERA